jgi:hypothetical protein
MSPRVLAPQQRVTRDVRTALRYAVGGLVAAAALAGSFVLVQRPAVVERVRIENHTAFDLIVDLVDADQRSVIPLGYIQPNGTDTVEDVFDVGEHWVFVVEREGVEITRIHMTRAQLVANRWVAIIRKSVEDRLVELGQTPCSGC